MLAGGGGLRAPKSGVVNSTCFREFLRGVAMIWEYVTGRMWRSMDNKCILFTHSKTEHGWHKEILSLEHGFTTKEMYIANIVNQSQCYVLEHPTLCLDLQECQVKTYWSFLRRTIKTSTDANEHHNGRSLSSLMSFWMEESLNPIYMFTST